MILKRSMIAAAALAAVFGAHAANLTVTGQITPDACAINLGANGNVDFGTMTRASVMTYPSEDSHYKAPGKAVSVTVTCSAPTNVALAWVDNKASTLTPIDVNDFLRFGLGQHGAGNVGFYTMSHDNLRFAALPTDTPQLPYLYMTRLKGSAGTFNDAAFESGMYFDKNFELTARLGAAPATPTPVSVITGEMMVVPHFNQQVVDTTGTVIRLDGSATVDLVYF